MTYPTSSYTINGITYQITDESPTSGFSTEDVWHVLQNLHSVGAYINLYELHSGCWAYNNAFGGNVVAYGYLANGRRLRYTGWASAYENPYQYFFCNF